MPLLRALLMGPFSPAQAQPQELSAVQVGSRIDVRYRVLIFSGEPDLDALFTEFSGYESS